MKSYKLFLYAILCAILIVSCSKDDSPTEPEIAEAAATANASGQPIPAIASMENVNGFLATIEYEISVGMGLPSTSMSMGFAAMGENVDAGIINVNSNNLGKFNAEEGTFYMTPGPNSYTPLSGVNFDGSNHNWSVSGGNGIPNLSGSIVSPKAFSVSAPVNNSTLSKASGFDVKWSTSSGESGARFLIVVAQISNDNNYIEIDEISNSGAYKVSSDKLTNLSGDCLLQVVKYKYKAITSGGKDYYMISEIVKSINIKLQ